MRCSIEVYPEESPAGRERLMQILAGYAEVYPVAWASVTCSKRRLGPTPTLELARDIQAAFGWKTAPHLTGRGRTREEVARSVEQLERFGLRSVVALRGDGPATAGEPFPTGAHLIASLRGLDPGLEISAACYPERHPESTGDRDDLAALHAKLDAGATRLITQFVLEVGLLSRFIHKLRSADIQAPVIAGLLIPVGTERVNRLAGRCGVRPCQTYDAHLFSALYDEAAQAGYDGVHLFTLNQPPIPTKGALHAGL